MASPPAIEPISPVPPAGTREPGRFAFRELGDQVGVFLSTLAINFAVFAILFLASLKLPAPEFAKLSLAAGLVPVVASILDLGTTQSCLKLSFECDDVRFLGFNLAVKTVFLALTLPAAGAAYWLGVEVNRIAIGAAGAGMAFWGAMRILEHRKREFRRLAWLNLSVALSRLAFGAAALVTQSLALILIALYVVAQLPAHLVSVRRAKDVLSTVRWSDAPMIMKISPVMFASGLLYGSLPVLTQSLVYARNDAAAASAMGVVAMFLAPLGLIATTLRAYILPEVLDKPLRSIRVFGVEKSGLVWVVGVFVLALVLGTAFGAVCIHFIYDQRFPQATTFFLIYFGATAIALPIGLLNVRAQRGSLVRIEALVNAARFGATAALALFAEMSPVTVVAVSAAILVIGEIALAALLTQASARSAPRAFSARGRG